MNKIKKSISGLFEIFFSISGFVPKHATFLRAAFIGGALYFSVYLINKYPTNLKLALIYFIIVEIAYMGFIFSVLSKNGYRKWFIRKWGEEKGFRIYEAILGFIFFNIGASIGYVAIASSSEIFSFVPKILFGIIIGIIFFGGLFVKMWATKAASVEIYYWKDMFLGRKISKFVKSGPYKYFNSPMYGVGQIQGYAFAVWYGSVLGILIMVLYQILIFTFLHNVENEFIQRVHIQRAA